MMNGVVQPWQPAASRIAIRHKGDTSKTDYSVANPAEFLVIS